MRTGVEEREAKLREEFARGLGRIGRRLSDLEEARAVPGAEEEAVRPAPARVAVRREHAELVTREPAPDDEETFGRAWPLVVEWRETKDTHPDDGRGLAWLEGEERLLEIEVALLTEFGLTLPPETEPLRGFGRSGQINWRLAALDDTRRELARRRLLRDILTLGLRLWWPFVASRLLALWARRP